MPTYTVLKPFALPDATTAMAGSSVELTARQAKYLLLSGKVEQDAGDSKIRDKKPAKKEN